LFPWLRLMRVGSRFIAASRVDLFATTRISLRVWPNDLDINFHVNNGRYLALADLGRIDWFVRAGLMGVARRQKALPVVGDAIAKFRRDLKLFQAFEIHTRLIGWDHKWGFIEHRFVRKSRVLGVVAIRGVFRGSGGSIDPGVFLAGLGRAEPSPILPDWVATFQRGSEELSDALRDEERSQGLRSPGT
jgi:acyl-CoA thioesterase FadM